MGYYKLIRDYSQERAVTGKLYSTSHYYNNRTQKMTERLHFICNTMENRDHMIPALVYRVQVTMSPKFKRMLPEVVQVPQRTGIRFHRGTLPEHSQGCILIAPDMEQGVTSMWLAEQSAHEETRLEICNNVKYYHHGKNE